MGAAVALAGAAALTVGIWVQGTATAGTTDSPAGGLALPASTVATGADPTVLEENPALLGFLAAPALAYQFIGSEDGGRVDGHGLFLGGSLLRGLALGAGVQFLESPLVPGDFRKWTLAASVGDGRLASVGVTYETLASDEDVAVDEYRSLGLSLALRPYRAVSLAAVARDLDAERFRGDFVTPTYVLGLGLRPFTDRITLAGDVTLASSGTTFRRARGLVGLDLLPGVGLAAGLTFREEGETEGSVLLQVATGHFGVGVGGFAATEGKDGTGRDGGFDPEAVALAAVLTAARTEALFEPSAGLVEVNLDGEMTERPWRTILGPRLPSLIETVLLLRRVRDDPVARGVFLRISGPTMDLATAHEIRVALEDVRRAGKRVVTYVEETGNAGYYVATAADRIAINPAGILGLVGLDAGLVFLSAGLAKLGVAGDFVATGPYKNAPDVFTRTAPSEAQLEAENSLLDSLYASFVETTARARNMTASDLRSLIDRGPYTPERARAAHLVDEVTSQPELRRSLAEDEGLPVVSDYGKAPLQPRAWGRPPKVAVVFLDGAIVLGESTDVPLTGTRLSGSTTLAEALDEAREDPEVRAVVLRVNSPGGSTTASEIIYDHVRLLAQSKPVVVSMGEVAASGGYYVSVGGDTILADPATITGSIGVFAGKLYGPGLLDRLGIKVVTLTRGEHADMDAFTRGFTEEERRLLADGVEEAYGLFLRRVSEERGIPLDEVRRIAQGRVYSGNQALERRLVDGIGTLADALDEARRRAGLRGDEEVELVLLPREPGLGEVLGRFESATARQGGLQAPPGGLPAAMARTLRRVPGLDAVLAGRLSEREPLALLPFGIRVR